MSDVAQEMDELRIALGEVDVLAAITRVVYDEAEWDGPDPLVVERVASLLGLIEKSTADAMAAFHRLHGAVADATPAPAGEAERWDYERGTAPGKGDAPAPGPVEGLGEQDLDIVQRIRARSPDNRYEGASDEELIELFRRNKRVLERSDEDVIAAMTRPR